MDVQRLAASDVPRYRALMLRAYAEAPDAFTSTPEERSVEPDSWWLKRIADPGGQSLAYGAFHDGRLIGTVTIEFSGKPKTRHKACLIGMFVQEACRGLGAGAKLVEAALDAAKARPEVRLVTLTVTEGNAPAVCLYERCGFRQFGVEPMAIATPGGYKSKVHMWLPLGEYDATRACVPVDPGQHGSTATRRAAELRPSAPRIDRQVDGMTPNHGRALAQHLRELEESLLLPDVRKSATLVELLADEFVEFGSSGRIYNKADLVSTLQAEVPSKQTASGFKLTELSPEVALLTYRIQLHDEPPVHTLRSSLWKQMGGRWRMIFHQATVAK